MLTSLLLTCALLSATIPKGVPFSEPALLQLLIPDIDKRISHLQDPACKADFQCVYRTRLVSVRRTNLGVRGRDLLVVLVHELDYNCTGCNSAILAVLDLPSKTILFRHKQEGAQPDELKLEKTSKGPWPMVFDYAVTDNHMDPGVRLTVTTRLTPDDGLIFVLSDPESLSPGQ